MDEDDELASLLELDIEWSLLDDIRLGCNHDYMCMCLWTCLDLVPESVAYSDVLVFHNECKNMSVVYEKHSILQFFYTGICKVFVKNRYFS